MLYPAVVVCIIVSIFKRMHSLTALLNKRSPVRANYAAAMHSLGRWRAYGQVACTADQRRTPQA
jgi:hypothetical protein